MRTVSADVFMDKFNSSEDGVLTGLGVKIRAKNIALSDEIAFGAIKMDAKDDTKIVGDFHALRGCFINFRHQPKLVEWQNRIQKRTIHDQLGRSTKLGSRDLRRRARGNKFIPRKLVYERKFRRSYRAWRKQTRLAKPHLRRK